MQLLFEWFYCGGVLIDKRASDAAAMRVAKHCLAMLTLGGYFVALWLLYSILALKLPVVVLYGVAFLLIGYVWLGADKAIARALQRARQRLQAASQGPHTGKGICGVALSLASGILALVVGILTINGYNNWL